MGDITEFRNNVKWYDEHLTTLLPQYRGKYVGVYGGRVCGAWDDMLAGLNAMADEGYEPGTFIVQHCVPREEDLTFVCHTDNPFRNPVPLFKVISLSDLQLTNLGATSFTIRTPSEGNSPYQAA